MNVFHSGISRLVVITLIVSLLTLFAADMPRGTVSASHGSFAKSQGVYRVPYDDGLTVTASETIITTIQTHRTGLIWAPEKGA